MQIKILIIMLLQTLIMPFIIGAIGARFYKKSSALFIILIAWVIAFFWINGQVLLYPKTPVEQLWVFLSVAVLITYFVKDKFYKTAMSLLYIVGLLIASWPVVQYELTFVFTLESGLFLAAGLFVIFVKSKNNRAAFTLSMACVLLGGVSALTSSLLMGQVIISLAAASGIYALLEIKHKFKVRQVPEKYLTVFSLMFFMLLYVVRVYVELNIEVTLSIMLAYIVSVFSFKNQSLVIAIIIYLLSLVIIVMDDSGSSYY